jgi:hypothetical protein
LYLGRLAVNTVTPVTQIDPAFGGQLQFAPDGSSLLFLGNAQQNTTLADLRRSDGWQVTTLLPAIVSSTIQYLPNGIAAISTYDGTDKPFVGTVDLTGALAPLVFPFQTYVYSQPIRIQTVGTRLVVLQTDLPTNTAHLLSYPEIPWMGLPIELDTNVTTFVAAGPDTVAYTALRRESELDTISVTGGNPTVIAASNAYVAYDTSPTGRYLHASADNGGSVFDSSRPGMPLTTLPCSETTPPGDTCAFLAAWSPGDQYVLDFGWNLGSAQTPAFPFGGYRPFDAPLSVSLSGGTSAPLALPAAPTEPWTWSAPLFTDSTHAVVQRVSSTTAAGDLLLVDLAANTATVLVPQALNALLVPNGGGRVLYTQGPANTPAGVFSITPR